jgi:hypothetical protein
MKLSEVPEGHLFVFEDNLYIKMREWAYIDMSAPTGIWNCLNLSGGVASYILEDLEVETENESASKIEL